MLSGVECDGLSVRAQDSRRLTEFPLGSFAVDLHHFFSGDRSGVDHTGPEINGVVPGALHALSDDVESRVGEAVSEGIQDLFFGKCLKIAIPHIDILRIEISVGVTEVRVRRVIAHVERDRIGEFSAGRHLAGQHVQDAVSAFLPALPDVEDRGRAIFCHPFHIDDIAHIEKDDRSRECSADSFEQDLFLLCQVVTAPFGPVVLVFAGRPADDHHGGF